MLNIPQLTAPQFAGFFVMGLIFLSVGLFCFISPFYKMLVSKNETIAEVIDIMEIERSRSGSASKFIAYYPVFRYTANGEEITIQHHIGSQFGSPYARGDTLILFYNSKSPRQYSIKEAANGEWGMVVFGLILTPVGILILTTLTKFFIIPFLKKM